MSFLSRIGSFLGLRRGAADPNDERMWSSSGSVYLSTSGLWVTGAEALRVSCVFQSVRLIAETLGSLPLIVYREQDDGGKQREKKHQLATLLRRRPNSWQTPQQFRETLSAHAALWGGGFAEIIVGPRGIEALIPLDPDSVEVEQLPNYRLRFVVREPNGTSRTLSQDRVFRVQGLGVHRFLGESLLKLSREAIGLWLAQEKFNSLFFRQGAKPSAVLEVPTVLSDKAFGRLKTTVNEEWSGLKSMHRIMLAEEGSKLKEIGFSAKDAQMVEARENQVTEIARWFNIPIHLLRAGDQPTFASIEMFNREFVDLTLRPWCVRWEQSILRDLVVEDDLFAEHLLDALMRGNTVERAQSYAIFVTNGIYTRNEVRLMENKNPLPGLDEPLTPLNMSTGKEEPAAPAPPPPPQQPRRKPEPDEDDDEDASASPPRRLLLIAQQAAARVVRKETSKLAEKAAKLASKPEAWAAWLEEFYAAHATLVAETLQLEPAVAREVADRHRNAILAGGLSALSEEVAIEELVTLALEQEASLAA